MTFTRIPVIDWSRRRLAPSRVQGRAPSAVEGLALSAVEGPALSAVEGPALSEVEGPALSAVEGPALSEVEGPALSAVEGPALSEVEGFTLVEVVIAIGLFVTMAIGVAQLIAMSVEATRAAREHSSAVVLAAAKMDQLRALEWTYEPALPGVPAVARSDLTTDVSDPSFAGAGPGLSASPYGTLAANTPPYVDYLDESGSWVGNGADPPGGAVFIRRWAIVPLPADPNRTLALYVLVTTVRLDRVRGGAWQRRSGVEALLVSVRTRRTP